VDDVSDTPTPDPALAATADDGGAIAGDGFGFQHDCIARLAIQMLTDESIVRITCETHEDAVLTFEDATHELVSCKTRSSGSPYSVATLISEGGVKHLSESWIHTGKACRSRLMTDGGLKDGPSDARALVAACESREQAQVIPWAQKLASNFDTDDQTLAAFLVGFSALTGNALGPRQHAGAINATRLRTWLRKTKLGELLADQCYSLLRDAVAACCRAAVGDPLRGIRLLDASIAPAASKERVRVASRQLDRESVQACLVQPALGGALLSADPNALDHTRLTLKLERGQVPPQVVAAAKRLRASWYEYESAQSLRAPGVQPGLEDVRARTLLAIADAVAPLDLTEPYGQRMYVAVREALKTESLSPLPVLGMSDELLLGLAFQATDECELFWSATFDADAEVG
jgi:Cap4 dsDNA endonuclease